MPQLSSSAFGGGGQIEVGYGLGTDKRHSRPADILTSG